MTGTFEAPHQIPIPKYTEEQILAPWTVIHVDTEVDQQIVETDAQFILNLAESLTLEATRESIPQISFQIPIIDRGPLEKPGDEPTRRLWELELRYGTDGTLTMLKMSTGYDLQSFRIKKGIDHKPAEISYFGHHTMDNKDSEENPIRWASEKRNHPLWIEYGKRKLEELVKAAKETQTSDPSITLLH